MLHRRLSWAQLIRNGVPPLFVLRPLAGGFTPPNVGDEYPAPDPKDKFQMGRARQMYEQRRIGARQELDFALAKSGRAPVAEKRRKEKSHGRG
jgi:hypothetical protein